MSRESVLIACGVVGWIVAVACVAYDAVPLWVGCVGGVFAGYSTSRLLQLWIDGV